MFVFLIGLQVLDVVVELVGTRFPHWRGTHALFVEERADLLKIRCYVQSHREKLAGLHDAFRRRNGGSPPPFDGVAELWFGGFDDLGSDDSTNFQARAELLADEANFIDLANSSMWLATENEVASRDGR